MHMTAVAMGRLMHGRAGAAAFPPYTRARTADSCLAKPCSPYSCNLGTCDSAAGAHLQGRDQAVTPGGALQALCDGRLSGCRACWKTERPGRLQDTVWQRLCQHVARPSQGQSAAQLGG